MSIENLENIRKRLIFRSWHRGTKELDLIFGPFSESCVPGFGEDDLAAYDRLLECNDPEVYGWVTGKATPKNPELASMIEKICTFIADRKFS